MRLLPTAKIRRRLGLWYVDLHYPTRKKKIMSVGPFQQFGSCATWVVNRADAGKCITEAIGTR